jgi:hypothetical protein
LHHLARVSDVQLRADAAVLKEQVSLKDSEFDEMRAQLKAAQAEAEEARLQAARDEKTRAAMVAALEAETEALTISVKKAECVHKVHHAFWVHSF